MKKQIKINLTAPLLTALGVALIIMKLGGVAPVAAWSWWIVTLPFWIGIAALVVFIVIWLVLAAFAAALAFVINRL